MRESTQRVLTFDFSAIQVGGQADQKTPDDGGKVTLPVERMIDLVVIDLASSSHDNRIIDLDTSSACGKK